MGRIRSEDGRPLDLGRPITELTLTVAAGEDGLRLDRLLKRYVTWRSRTRLKERCSGGRVTVSGVPRKGGTRVRAGDLVHADLGDLEEEVRHDRIPLAVIYEDDHLVAIDKQAGVVVHPVGRYLFNTLLNALHLRYRRPDDPAHDIVPKLCHRLDRDTSGVLLVSKDDRIRRSLSFQFHHGLVEKEYAAIVDGVVAPEAGVIDGPIGPSSRGDHRMRRCVRADGLEARTGFEVLGRGAAHTVVAARPRQGRTHQIRVHLEHLGHPIVGDPLYGRRPPPAGLERQALHNRLLRFYHVFLDRFVRLEATLPADLRAFCRRHDIRLSDRGRALLGESASADR
ncbi:MAG: RluA family pseudouridine synthase [Planctomycetes bacterium]|nr:RluA family pseudouridine synthase [Planctomycetota bacterium]